jgi:predicted ArsR family transcriptional regulator
VDRRKDEILAFLKASGTASLAEIAAHLEISKQGALRHIDALQLEGLVERTPAIHAGPGRPGHAYHLTAAAAERFPHSHRQLAAELVNFMPSAEVERFFAARAARIEEGLALELAGLSLAQKVKRLAELATAGGHMSEVVDNGDGTYAIRHCNCPIADVAVATGHPCHHEQSMYRRLLGATVERTSWVADSDPNCTYVIKAEKRGATNVG